MVNEGKICWLIIPAFPLLYAGISLEMKVHSCELLCTYIEQKDVSSSCNTITSYSARYNLEHRTKTIKSSKVTRKLWFIENTSRVQIIKIVLARRVQLSECSPLLFTMILSIFKNIHTSVYAVRRGKTIKLRFRYEL
jgi:hypothetical protein